MPRRWPCSRRWSTPWPAFTRGSRRSGEGEFDEEAAWLLSKTRTIAAYSYRRSMGYPFIYSDPRLSYGGDFLHMLFSQPLEEYLAPPEIVDALNLILILHADHELGCSTTTVRIVGSSQANLFASCAAGICSLWGPVHGGATIAVIEMLEAIERGRSRSTRPSRWPGTSRAGSGSRASATGSTSSSTRER